jgi:probable phosphoglycerate mutase
MLKIYLTHHGQDRDNANGILNGRRDGPLTAIGREQAQQIAARIKAVGLVFDKIYCSPLQRAAQTAQIISMFLDARAPICLEDLIEREQGKMTGQRVCDVEKMCAPHILKTDLVTYFTSAEGAETFPEMRDRAQRSIWKASRARERRP